MTKVITGFLLLVAVVSLSYAVFPKPVGRFPLLSSRWWNIGISNV